MQIIKYQPKILHQYIESINVYCFEGEVAVQLQPKGTFEVVFQDDHLFEHNTFYSKGWEARPENFVGGLHDHFYDVKPRAINHSCYCIAVEFKPIATKHFIHGPLNVFKNELVDIFDVWGKSGRELSMQLRETKSNDNRVKMIENFLTQQFLQKQKSSIEKSVKSIHLKNGFIKIHQLVKEAELSPAQFRKRFNEEIGISPSQYCKINRVNAMLPILSTTNRSLTEVAYDLGYFDQSHFIKDFKSITGASPKNYLIN